MQATEGQETTLLHYMQTAEPKRAPAQDPYSGSMFPQQTDPRNVPLHHNMQQCVIIAAPQL